MKSIIRRSKVAFGLIAISVILLLIQRVSTGINEPPQCQPPSTTNPAHRTACAGGSVTFTVSASGTGPFSYQWRKGGNSLTNGPTGNGSTYSNVNSATLQISNVAIADAVSASSGFDCVVTGQCGSPATSSKASLTVHTQPVGSISGLGVVCTSSTNTYTGSSGTGLTYGWTIAGNGTIIGSTISQSVSVVTTTVGSFTLTQSVSVASCSATGLKHVVVLADCDGDGVLDADETNIYHTDPHNPDADGDGLTDGEEVYVYSTNPLIRDTDCDGVFDGEEVTNGTNPLENPSGACCRTYTVDADFDEGELVGVEHDAPHHDQLHLQTAIIASNVWIACSTRGTIVRIDINSGAVLGEYWTAPENMSKNPSRTTVDRKGNVWVSNRDEGSNSQGENKGSVTRVGVVVGGTRGDKVLNNGTFTFVPNTNGYYIASPFEYCTCQDRNGDGYIKTSLGLGDVLPWPNTNDADRDGGISTTEDECIINYTRTKGTNARTVAITANNDVWVGGWVNHWHEKLSGITGQPVTNTQFKVEECGGYGGLVDTNNVLWSAGCCNQFLRYDTIEEAGTCTTHANYGIALDPNTGHIWVTDWVTDSGNGVYELDADGNELGGPFNTGSGGGARGIAVDRDGNVWVANSSGSSVGHLRTNGVFVGDVVITNGTGISALPHGVAIDIRGNVWAANLGQNSAARIDPTKGPIVNGFHVGEVDLHVSLIMTNSNVPGYQAYPSPYNYSDMTGYISKLLPGTWTVIHDGGYANTPWAKVTWTASTPSNSTATVKVRTAGTIDNLASNSYVTVTNGVAFSNVPDGRYIQVQVTLSGGISPILYDLTICPSSILDQPPIAIAQNVVTNTSPGEVTQTVPADRINAGSSDSDGQLTNIVVTPWTLFPVGTNSVTLTVTDDRGASSSSNALVIVRDLQAPSLSCPVDVTGFTEPALSMGTNLPPAVSCILGANLVSSGSYTNTYYGPDYLPGTNLTYSWSIAGNGTIIGGGDTNRIKVASGNAGTYTLNLTYTNTSIQFGSACQKLVTVRTNQITSILGGQLFSRGGDIIVEVLKKDAALVSELWLYSSEPPYTNVLYIAKNTEEGKVVNIGSYPAGTEVLFGIKVSGTIYRMGPAHRNPDNYVHNLVSNICDGVANVGFEDLPLPSSQSGEPDYNDNTFRFSPVDVIPSATNICSTSSSNVVLGWPLLGDNWGIQSLTNDAPTQFSIGDTPVHWIVTDLAGNTNNCTQTVHILAAPPVFLCPPTVIVTVNAGTNVATNVVLGMPVQDTYCEPYTLTNDAPSAFPLGFPLGTNTVTWTATSASSNQVQCTQQVIVLSSATSTWFRVVLIEPANQERFAIGAPISLVAQATASTSTVSISKVAFYEGTTQLGEDTTSPTLYTFTWTNASVGTHSLAAAAIDSSQQKTNWSTVVVIRVGDGPTVSLTAPTNQALFAAGANITLSADASEQGGTITNVEFFANNVKLGEDATASYGMTWSNVLARTYTLVAKAWDSLGVATTSPGITITVNASPNVTLLAPISNLVVQAGSPVALLAAARDTDGRVTNVAFYAGSTLISMDTSSPYTASWTATNACTTKGFYAVALDNRGVTAVSSTTSVTVVMPPTVALTSPTNSVFQFGDPIPLAATASNACGVTITKVEFYQGSNLFLTDIQSPYGFTWQYAAPNTYTFTARATDSAGGISNSVPVTFRVNAPPTVSMTSPAFGAYFEPQSNILVKAEFADADGTIQTVKLLKGTNTLLTANPNLVSDTISITTNFPLGVYFFSAVVTDNDGAIRTSDVTQVRVDSMPTITLSSPTNGAVYSQIQSIPISAVADDDALQKITLTANSLQLLATNVVGTTNAAVSFSWSGAAPGDYQVRAKVTDQAGHKVFSPIVNIKVLSTNDVTLPVAYVTAVKSTGGSISPGQTVSNVIIATASGTDDHAVTHVYLGLDPYIIAQKSNGDHVDYTLDTRGLTNGLHSLFAWAIDSSWNLSTNDAIFLIDVQNAVDTNPPTVFLVVHDENGSLVASNQTVSGTVIASVTATSQYGVARQELLLDGSLIASNDGRGPLQFTLDTHTVSNTLHQFSAVAYNMSFYPSPTNTLPFIATNAVAGLDTGGCGSNVCLRALLSSPTDWTLTVNGSTQSVFTGTGTVVAGCVPNSAFPAGYFTYSITTPELEFSSAGIACQLESGEPLAIISNLTDGQMMTNGLFDLQGIADHPHPSAAISYQISLYKSDGYTLLADVTPPPLNTQFRHNGRVHPPSGTLGTIDFTMVPNGSYYLMLTVVANLSNGTSQTKNSEMIHFTLDSQLKVGQFSFSQQDLVIPVSGVPLSVIRTYNSLNGDAGSFGYSWTFAMNDLQMTFSDDHEETEDMDGQFFNMRAGSYMNRHITLTLPDGRRTTYRFSLASGEASWTPPPGVTASLKVEPRDAGRLHPWGGWLKNQFLPMENYDFPGYVLETVNGTKYHIKRDPDEHFLLSDEQTSSDWSVTAYNGPAYLTEIEDRGGNRIRVSSAGLKYVDPTGAIIKTVPFAHNDARFPDFITDIWDPQSVANNNNSTNGLVASIRYFYDTIGNLTNVTKVTSRAPTNVYERTTYVYDKPSFPHLITEIKDSRGLSPLRNLYDDDGRLYAVVDALGKTNRVEHGLTARTETTYDRMGNATVQGYDDRGNVTQTIQNLDGRQIVTSRAYDGNNNQTSETDPLGHTTTYEYNGNGNRTKVIDALGRTNSVVYTGTGDVLTQTDPLGNTTSNEYDGQGQGHLLATVSPLGQRTENTYDPAGNLATTKDALGQVTGTFGYDASGNRTSATDASGLTYVFGYDANGNQTGTTLGTVHTYTDYDSAGRVTRTVDADGNVIRTFYNAIGKIDFTIDTLGHTNRFLYDARGSLVQTKYADGTATAISYDDNARPVVTVGRYVVGSSTNRATRSEYDALGRTTNSVRLADVTINISVDGNGVASSTITGGTQLSTSYVTYDDAGRVTARTGPDGQTSRYFYNSAGNVTNVVDALTNSTSYGYDAARRRTSMTDALQHTTQFAYDALGRLFKTTYHDGTWTSNIFNNVGQKIAEIDQTGLRTDYEYSPCCSKLTAVVKPQVPDPENGNQMVRPRWEYEYDQNGRLFVTRDPKGRATTNTYDVVGRQISRSLPMGQSETNVYNAFAQLAAKTNFNGNVERFFYDSFGRIATQQFYTATGTLMKRVCIKYDELGRQKRIVELQGSGLTSPGCDVFAALKSTGTRGVLAMLLPMMGLMSFPWRSLRISMWRLLAFLRHPILSVCHPDPALAGEGSLSFGRRFYIARLRALRNYRLLPRWLRLISLLLIPVLFFSFLSPGLEVLAVPCTCASNGNDIVRVTEFTYDADSHVTQICSPEGTINYEYAAATGRHTNTWTTSNNVGYTYDELGRLKTVEVKKRNGVTVNPPEVTTYHYTDVGTRQEIDLPNGTKTTYEYDSLNRLKKLENRNSSNALLSSFEYLLHSTGRRTNATEIVMQVDDSSYVTNNTSWTYDGMYRLTKEVRSQNPGASSQDDYVYDLVGNRKTKTTGAATIQYYYNNNDQLTNEVATTNTTAYRYDTNGSLTNQVITGSNPANYAYAYNVQNQMSSVTVAGATTSYLYNHAGIRVRTAGSSSKFFLTDPNNPTAYAQVLEEASTLAGAPTISYVMGDDVLAQVTSSSVSYLLYDGYGSTRQVSRSGNTVVEQYNYDAYGVAVSGLSGSPATTMLYAGEQFDTNLQQYYLRARYYNPNNGRFNQLDSFEGDNYDPPSLHKYAYGQGDPINRIDPSGHTALLALILAALLVAAGGLYIIATELSFATPRGSCGPEVKSAVDLTLKKVGDDFDGWTSSQQMSACDFIYYGGSWNPSTAKKQLKDAWDTTALFELGWRNRLQNAYQDSPPVDFSTVQGTRSCSKTVAFDGKAYAAGSVNYALWGKMNKLCHDKFGAGKHNLFIAKKLVQLWKAASYKDIFDTEKQALAFTEYGYSGLAPSSLNYPNCQVRNGNNWSGTSYYYNSKDGFHYNWEPVQGRDPNAPVDVTRE